MKDMEIVYGFFYRCGPAREIVDLLSINNSSLIVMTIQLTDPSLSDMHRRPDHEPRSPPLRLQSHGHAGQPED